MGCEAGKAGTGSEIVLVVEQKRIDFSLAATASRWRYDMVVEVGLLVVIGGSSTMAQKVSNQTELHTLPGDAVECNTKAAGSGARSGCPP